MKHTLSLLILMTTLANAKPVVTGLVGEFRHGQVFLTWNEAATAPGTTFNVYSSRVAINEGTLATAKCLARRIEAHSARDWWCDPASFSKDEKPGVPVGFQIKANAPKLDPAGGLFVHTVVAETVGIRFYAVTWTDAQGVEHKECSPGGNTLVTPIAGKEEPVQPIWLGTGSFPVGGDSLWVSLHGRGGGATAGKRKNAVNCLWFGNAEQGWREGLPFKFRLNADAKRVVITPYDRVWVGRPILESHDGRDHCPAINTWWFGYPAEIWKPTSEAKIAPNFTEKYLLGLIHWARRHYRLDPACTYIYGGSMGGSGSVAMALHFPEEFAAVSADVPVYSCTYLGRSSASRIECMFGPLKGRDIRTLDGIPLLDQMNGIYHLKNKNVDLPPIFATNGRTDGSIPWENNPPFYSAANEARQSFAVFWNNGAHGMSREAPADVKRWRSLLRRYRSDRPFPVFTNCSDNRNYGDGNPKKGDLIGWINRGITWSDVHDTPAEFAISLRIHHPEITYPVQADITPRRLQNFKVKAGETLLCSVNGGKAAEIVADANGLVTVPAVSFASSASVKVLVQRKK